MEGRFSAGLELPAPQRALIVSYSYSGNTQHIARRLQSVTGSDWSEIYPWQPYPIEFPELLELVRSEVNAGYRPRLLPGARSPRPYPVIMVGSPNWCGTIAPPLASWIYKNDLSGKLVLPFCSHCGGVDGDLRQSIAALCPRANVGRLLKITGKGDGDLDAVLCSWLEQEGASGIRQVRDG